MANVHHALIEGVCLVVFLATFLSGCAGNSPGDGYNSPRALVKAVHAATIAGDYEAVHLCIDPRYRDRFAESFALATEYMRKVDAGAKLIEEKLGKEVANDFRRKYLQIMCRSPFDDAVKEAQIQWKRIHIRVEADRAWVEINGTEVLQAVQNPAGRWFVAPSKSEASPDGVAYGKGLIESGIEEIDKTIQKVIAGEMGEEIDKILRKLDAGEMRKERSIIITSDGSSQWPQEVEAIVDADATELLPGTKAVGGKGVRMLPARPFEVGGFVAWVTINSELKNSDVFVVYAHPVDTEVSISIDGGKPIKVRLPKTNRGQDRTWAAKALGPLSKGKHKVQVYATHNSGVSHLDWVLFVRTQPN